MTTIAVIGASARAAAQSARRAGLHVVAADRFADADLAATLRANGPVYPAVDWDGGLADWLDSTDAEAWLYCGPLENRPELVDQLAHRKPLWGVAAASLRRVRSPEQLAAVVCRSGWRTPPLVRDPRGLPSDGSWLCKRDHSGGGCGVTVWSGEDGGADLLDGPRHWQQRVPGTPRSALFCASPRGVEFLTVAAQLCGQSWCAAPEFHYCGAIAPLSVMESQRGKLQALGDALAESFQLRGLFGVDFMAADDGWYVLEVNPRYTASVEAWELAAGESALARHAAAFHARADGARNLATAGRAASASAAPQLPTVVGKAILYARRPLLIDATTSAAWLATSSWRGFDGSDVLVADIPPPDTQIAAGSPVATVLVRADSPVAARSRLETAAAAVYNQMAACEIGEPAAAASPHD